MNTFIVHPANEEQEKELKAFFKSLDITYEEEPANQAGKVANGRISDKFRGIFTKEDAENFDAHVKTMRNEWDNI